MQLLCLVVCFWSVYISLTRGMQSRTEIANYGAFFLNSKNELSVKFGCRISSLLIGHQTVKSGVKINADCTEAYASLTEDEACGIKRSISVISAYAGLGFAKLTFLDEKGIYECPSAKEYAAFIPTQIKFEFKMECDALNIVSSVRFDEIEISCEKSNIKKYIAICDSNKISAETPFSNFFSQKTLNDGSFHSVIPIEHINQKTADESSHKRIDTLTIQQFYDSPNTNQPLPIQFSFNKSGFEADKTHDPTVDVTNRECQQRCEKEPIANSRPMDTIKKALSALRNSKSSQNAQFSNLKAASAASFLWSPKRHKTTNGGDVQSAKSGVVAFVVKFLFKVMLGLNPESTSVFYVSNLAHFVIFKAALEFSEAFKKSQFFKNMPFADQRHIGSQTIKQIFRVTAAAFASTPHCTATIALLASFFDLNFLCIEDDGSTTHNEILYASEEHSHTLVLTYRTNTVSIELAHFAEDPQPLLLTPNAATFVDFFKRLAAASQSIDAMHRTNGPAVWTAALANVPIFGEAAASARLPIVLDYSMQFVTDNGTRFVEVLHVNPQEAELAAYFETQRNSIALDTRENTFNALKFVIGTLVLFNVPPFLDELVAYIVAQIQKYRRFKTHLPPASFGAFTLELFCLAGFARCDAAEPNVDAFTIESELRAAFASPITTFVLIVEWLARQPALDAAQILAWKERFIDPIGCRVANVDDVRFSSQLLPPVSFCRRSRLFPVAVKALFFDARFSSADQQPILAAFSAKDHSIHVLKQLIGNLATVREFKAPCITQIVFTPKWRSFCASIVRRKAYERFCLLNGIFVNLLLLSQGSEHEASAMALCNASTFNECDFLRFACEIVSSANITFKCHSSPYKQPMLLTAALRCLLNCSGDECIDVLRPFTVDLRAVFQRWDAAGVYSPHLHAIISMIEGVPIPAPFTHHLLLIARFHAIDETNVTHTVAAVTLRQNPSLEKLSAHFKFDVNMKLFKLLFGGSFSNGNIRRIQPTRYEMMQVLTIVNTATLKDSVYDAFWAYVKCVAREIVESEFFGSHIHLQPIYVLMIGGGGAFVDDVDHFAASSRHLKLFTEAFAQFAANLPVEALQSWARKVIALHVTLLNDRKVSDTVNGLLRRSLICFAGKYLNKPPESAQMIIE